MLDLSMIRRHAALATPFVLTLLALLASIVGDGRERLGPDDLRWSRGANGNKNQDTLLCSNSSDQNILGGACKNAGDSCITCGNGISAGPLTYLNTGTGAGNYTQGEPHDQTCGNYYEGTCGVVQNMAGLNCIPNNAAGDTGLNCTVVKNVAPPVPQYGQH